MIGGIFVIWIDPPHDSRPKERTIEIIEHMGYRNNGNQSPYLWI